MTGCVIVTGGLGTLGKAVVTDLVNRGLHVAIVDKAPAPADCPADIVIGDIDLALEKDVGAAFAKVSEKVGVITGLVNVAGGFVWEPVETGSLDTWDRMYRMNVLTAAASSRAALPYLLQQGGAVVNVGSAAANKPGLGMAPYGASKAGVRALTESLADELKARGVRVNAVLPTIIDTPVNRRDMPQADFSTWVKPEAAARVIAFLLSDQSAAITGTCIELSLAG